MRSFLGLTALSVAVVLADLAHQNQPNPYSKSGSGTSGKRFSGNVIRKSDAERRFSETKQTDLDRKDKHCEKWVVVTSIFAPTKATRKYQWRSGQETDC